MKDVFRSGDSSKKFKIAEGQWHRYAPSYVSPAYHLLEGFPFIQEPPSGDLQERVLIRHHDYDQCFQSVQLLQWNSQVKFFFFHAGDGIRATSVTGVQTCALPISPRGSSEEPSQHEAREVAARERRAAGEDVVVGGRDASQDGEPAAREEAHLAREAAGHQLGEKIGRAHV